MKRLLYDSATLKRATLFLNGTNLKFTAVSQGTAGNSIKVQILAAGTEDQATVITKTSAGGVTTLKVNIGTGDNVTVDDFATAWNAGGANSADVATLTVENGAAIVSAVAATALAGGEDDFACYPSNKLVAAVTSSGEVKLHFDIANNEEPDVDCEAVMTLTCTAGKEKDVLEELYANINDGQLGLIDVLSFGSVSAVASVYDIDPS